MRTVIIVAVLALAVAGEAAPTKHRPGALVLLLDRSGSMKGARLDAAKTAALAAVYALDPTDQVAIVTFDTDADVVVPLQSAGNQKPIAQQIAKIESGGGTAFVPALSAALAELGNSKAASKHVLLFTDGESPSEGVSELIAKLRAANVTVSTIAVGDADTAFLGKISTSGNGHSYFVGDLKVLPRVFARDIADALQ